MLNTTDMPQNNVPSSNKTKKYTSIVENKNRNNYIKKSFFKNLAKIAFMIAAGALDDE